MAEHELMRAAQITKQTLVFYWDDTLQRAEPAA
jgi:hypothetical protein